MYGLCLFWVTLTQIDRFTAKSPRSREFEAVVSRDSALVKLLLGLKLLRRRFLMLEKAIKHVCTLGTS